MTRRRLLFAGLVTGAAASAQSVVSVRPGLCYYAEGDVQLNGRRIAQDGMQLDYVEPESPIAISRGRAEVLLGPHSLMRVGPATEVEVANASLERPIVRLRHGSIIVDVLDRFDRETVTVETPEARIELSDLGVYRFDMWNEWPVSVRVFQGHADILAENKNVRLGRGEWMRVDDFKRRSFNVRRGDKLDAWGQQRRDELARARDVGLPTNRRRSRRRPGMALH